MEKHLEVSMHSRTACCSAAMSQTILQSLTRACLGQMDLQLAEQCEVAAMQMECGGEASAASAAFLPSAAALRQGVAAALDSLAARALLRHAIGHDVPKVGATPLTLNWFINHLMAQLIRPPATYFAIFLPGATLTCMLVGSTATRRMPQGLVMTSGSTLPHRHCLWRRACPGACAPSAAQSRGPAALSGRSWALPWSSPADQ